MLWCYVCYCTFFKHNYMVDSKKCLASLFSTLFMHIECIKPHGKSHFTTIYIDPMIQRCSRSWQIPFLCGSRERKKKKKRWSSGIHKNANTNVGFLERMCCTNYFMIIFLFFVILPPAVTKECSNLKPLHSSLNMISKYIIKHYQH